MIRKHLMLLSFALCLAAVRPSGLTAAEDVVSLIPQNAVGFVLISRVGEANGKLEKLAAQLEMKIQGPLGMFKKLSGIDKGLDEKGNAALVYLPGEAGVIDGFPIALLPVADYQALVTQFGAQDPEAEIIEVPVAGEPVLIGRKGGYAVFAEPEHEDALKKILADKKGIGPGLESLRSWMAKNDVSAVATASGVQLAIKQGLEGLEAAKKGFEDMKAQLGEDQQDALEQAAQGLQIYTSLFRFVGKEVSVAGIGLHISDEGDVHVKTRTVFTEGGRVTQFAAKVKPLGRHPLAGLPAKPFVIAGGANFPGEMSEAIAKWSLHIIKASPSMYGFKKLTDEEAKKLAEISSASMRNVKWVSLLMGPGEGDEPLYGSVVASIGVSDAKQYLSDYEKQMKVWNEIADKAEGGRAMRWELERVEIAGEKGLKASMDVANFAAAGQPAVAQMMEEMMEKMFGPGGKLTAYFAPADQTTVMMAYTSKKNLEEAIASYKSGESDLSQDPLVAQTAAKLPKDAMFIGYLNLGEGVAFVNRIVQNFAPIDFELPEFDDQPPVGAAVVLSATGMETDLVMPIPTLKAFYEYVRTVQEAALAPQFEFEEELEGDSER